MPFSLIAVDGGAEAFFRTGSYADALSLPLTLGLSFLSVLVSGLIGYATFSILCRQHRRLMLAFYLLQAALMLIPVRELPLGILPLVAASLVLAYLDRAYFRKFIEYSTPEGVAVRFLFLFPLIIMLIRAAFYVSGDLGYCLVSAAIAWLLFYVSCSIKTFRVIREILLFAVYAAGVYSIFHGASYLLVSLKSFSVEALLYISPLILWSAFLYFTSDFMKWFYRSAMTLLLFILSLIAWFDDGNSLVLSVLLVMSAGFAIWGALVQRKIPVILGSALVCLGTVILVFRIIEGVTFNSWILLVALGLVALVGSSVVDKYGKLVTAKYIGTAKHFSSWKF